MLEYIHALELRTTNAEATVARKNAQVGIVPSHQLSLVVESILECFIKLTVPNFHHTPDLRFLKSPFVHTDPIPQEPAEIARNIIEPDGIGHTERVQQNLIGLRATLHEPRSDRLTRSWSLAADAVGDREKAQALSCGKDFVGQQESRQR